MIHFKNKFYFFGIFVFFSVFFFVCGSNAGADIIDNFNRSNNSTSLGQTTTGQTWMAQSGTWGIENNRARVYTVQSGVNDQFAVVDSVADGFVQATLSQFDKFSGLAFRYVDSRNNWTLITTDTVPPEYNVNKRVNGSLKTIGVIKQTAQAGDVLRVETSGTTFRIFINGVQKMELTGQTDHLSASKVGFLAWRDRLVRFDDFSATSVGTVNPVCGNGVVESGETCDEGSNNGQSGHCNTSCTGTVPVASCGNVLLTSGPYTFNKNVSSAVILPHNSSYLISAGSIVVKFRLNNTQTEQAPFSKESKFLDTGGHIMAYIGIGGDLNVRMQSTTQSYWVQTATGVVKANVDNHLAVTFGPSGLKVYLNGVQVGSNAYTGGLLGNLEDWVIGANGWESDDLSNNKLVMPMNGTVQEFKVYDQQLSAGAISNLAAGLGCTLNLIELVSPVPGSTIFSSSTTFQWTDRSDVTEAMIAVGTRKGGGEILYWTPVWPNLSKTVDNIPLDGNSIYFSLYYKTSTGTWLSLEESFVTVDNTPKPFMITNPVPGSTLTSSTVNFQWSVDSELGVQEVWMAVGTTEGGSDIYYWSNTWPNLSTTISNIPLTGKPIYLDIWYRTSSNAWTEVKAMYETPNQGGSSGVQLLSPAPGSLLTSSPVTFNWSNPGNVSEAWLAVGSKPTGSDLSSGWAQMWPNLNQLVNIPLDGRVVYFEMWYKTSANKWFPLKAAFSTENQAGPSPVSLSSPLPGSALVESSFTLNWIHDPSINVEWLGVGTSYKDNGSLDTNILNWQQVWPSTSKTLTNIPLNGDPIYFEMWYQYSGQWLPLRATYRTQ